MIKKTERIQVGQVFEEDGTARHAIVTGFGTSQGDETTIQLTGMGGQEKWGGEYSASIFQQRFTGPLSIKVG